MADLLCLTCSDNAWVVLQTKQGVTQQGGRGNAITNDEEWIHNPEQQWGEVYVNKLIAPRKTYPLGFKAQKQAKNVTVRQAL